MPTAIFTTPISADLVPTSADRQKNMSFKSMWKKWKVFHKTFLVPTSAELVRTSADSMPTSAELVRTSADSVPTSADG